MALYVSQPPDLTDRHHLHTALPQVLAKALKEGVINASDLIFWPCHEFASRTDLQSCVLLSEVSKDKVSRALKDANAVGGFLNHWHRCPFGA